jgi:uncharacterized protein (DUF305 family)
MKKTLILAAMAATLTFSANCIAADTMKMDHSKMDHSKMSMDMSAMAEPKGDQGPSSKAYAEANAKMHDGMNIDFSGDADIDFVRGMIAHHQGAIDMAKVQLTYGKDAEIKALSEGIIKAQEGEITMMKEWLAKHGK